MVDFKALLKKHLEKGEVKSVITQLKTEWDLDEQVVGRLVDIVDVHFPKTNNTVNGYIFETDGGLVQFTLGANVDLQSERAMPINHVFACTFKGKKDISEGRTMNIFEVLDLGEYEDGKDTKSKTTDSGQTGKKQKLSS